MYITLSDAERRLAEELGNARCEAKRPSVRQVDHIRYSGQGSRVEPHIVGLAGEIAVARYLDQTLDTSLLAGGDTADFGGIEVKTSTFQGREVELKVPMREFLRKRPDLYVLCRTTRDLRWVEILGAISRADFEREKTVKDYGYGPCYTVPATKLRPLNSVVVP